MAIVEVRSPNNSSPDSPHWGTSPGARSSPSNAPRSDSGSRRDNEPTPPLNTEGTAELEAALAKGMRNERR
jgi:hypothetical protein